MVDEVEKKKRARLGRVFMPYRTAIMTTLSGLRCAVRDFGYIDKLPAHTQLPKSLLWIQGSPWGFRVATVGA